MIAVSQHVRGGVKTQHQYKTKTAVVAFVWPDIVFILTMGGCYFVLPLPISIE